MSIDTSHLPGPARAHHLPCRAWVELLDEIQLAALPAADRWYLDPVAVKAVGLRLACYASPDGARVYPDVARLAVELEMAYDAAQAALALLCELRLLRLVAPARRPGDLDEYRLCGPADRLAASVLPVRPVTPLDRYRAVGAHLTLAATGS